MNKKLLLEAISKYLLGIVLIGILLYVPAGTIKWFNGNLFMLLLFVPMFIAGIIMYLKAPNLLRSRLSAKEKQGEQKDVVKYSGLMFLVAFIIAGLNYRFKWIILNNVVVIIGSIIFLLSYLMFGEVLRENAYLYKIRQKTH